MKGANRATMPPSNLSVCKARRPNSRSSSSRISSPSQHRNKMFFSLSLIRSIAPLKASRLPSSPMDRRGQVKRTACKAALTNQMGWSNKPSSTSKHPCKNHRITNTGFLAKWSRSTTRKWPTSFCLRKAHFADSLSRKTINLRSLW